MPTSAPPNAKQSVLRVGIVPWKDELLRGRYDALGRVVQDGRDAQAARALFGSGVGLAVKLGLRPERDAGCWRLGIVLQTSADGGEARIRVPEYVAVRNAMIVNIRTGPGLRGSMGGFTK